jgi:hypothetical protein
VVVRAQYAINTHPNTGKPVTLPLEQQWRPGNIAWNTRDKDCRDDRDRIYVLVSLVVAGNSDILQTHLFIFTETGYMDLARPDTATGDVVVVLGGPGTAVVIRDTPLMTFSEPAIGEYSQAYADTTAKHDKIVESKVSMLFSHLMGHLISTGSWTGSSLKDEGMRKCWSGRQISWERFRGRQFV